MRPLLLCTAAAAVAAATAAPAAAGATGGLVAGGGNAALSAGEVAAPGVASTMGLSAPAGAGQIGSVFQPLAETEGCTHSQCAAGCKMQHATRKRKAGRILCRDPSRTCFLKRARGGLGAGSCRAALLLCQLRLGGWAGSGCLASHQGCASWLHIFHRYVAQRGRRCLPCTLLGRSVSWHASQAAAAGLRACRCCAGHVRRRRHGGWHRLADKLWSGGRAAGCARQRQAWGAAATRCRRGPLIRPRAAKSGLAGRGGGSPGRRAHGAAGGPGGCGRGGGGRGLAGAARRASQRVPHPGGGGRGALPGGGAAGWGDKCGGEGGVERGEGRPGRWAACCRRAGVGQAGACRARRGRCSRRAKQRRHGRWAQPRPAQIVFRCRGGRAASSWGTLTPACCRRCRQHP